MVRESARLKKNVLKDFQAVPCKKESKEQTDANCRKRTAYESTRESGQKNCRGGQKGNNSARGSPKEGGISVKQEITDPEEPHDPLALDVVCEGTSSKKVFEVVKHELDILNIKKEIEDAAEGEDYSNTEFSGYEDLLKNITVQGRNGLKIADDGSSGEDEDAVNNSDEDEEKDDDEDYIEDDEDDPDDPDDPDETYDEYAEYIRLCKRKKVDNSKYCCFECDFKCDVKGELAAHLKTHKSKILKCEYCGDVFIKESARKRHLTYVHQDIINDSTLKEFCKYCNRGYKTKQLLEDHVRIHTGETPFECNKCSKKFRRRGGLLQHLRYHLQIRPFECNVCHRRFKSKSHKNSHMKQHFGVKDYKCEDCGKDFVRKDQLKKHILCVHNQKFMYTCSICNKSFKGHVLSHLRIHMNEKQFKCKECGKCFIQSSQLNVHMRTHTGAKPYQCEVCKVFFSHSSAVRVHMRIHTGEKPIKCQLCPAAFKQLPHLKKHMRCVHKSDKPYVCVPCKAFFAKKNELEDHVSTKKCKPPEDFDSFVETKIEIEEVKLEIV